MDLAELGIVYVSEGADAAIAKSKELRDATIALIGSDEDRVKAANKVVTATEALSNQITRSIVSYQNSQAAQYEFAAIAMGANDQLFKQIELLKTLEEMEALATSTARELSNELRREEGILLDLAKDYEILNKAKLKEAQESEAARSKELASRQAYYSKIISDAKEAEQTITNTKHKAIVDQQNERDRLVAMYTKDEQVRVKQAEKDARELAVITKRTTDDAIKQAEQKALGEMSWAKKSRDEQMRIKSEIAAYQNAGISAKTIGSTFGEASIGGTVKAVDTLAEKFDKVHFNVSRVRTEMVVIAHEAIQGRFSRIPASMMVFAEYADLSSLALSGLGLTLMAAAAAVAVLGIAMVKGLLEQRDLQNALIMTGNYAGTTADALNQMAHNSVALGGSLSTAKGIILELAASGKFTAEQIQVATAAIVAMEHATGGGDEMVKQLTADFKSLQVEINSHSRYSDELSKAVVKLDSTYHFLSTSVLANIRALEDEGRTKEASRIATDEFAKVTESRAKEIVANLGNIEMGWRKIKEAIGGAWSSMKDWGKTETSQSKLEKEVAKLEELRANQKAAGGGLAEARAGSAIVDQQQVILDLRKRIFQESERAYEQGERTRKQTEANVALIRNETDWVQIKADKIGEFEKKIAAARQNLVAILNSPTITPEVAARETAKNLDIIKKYEEDIAKAEKGSTPKAEQISAFTRLADEIAKVAQKAEDMASNGDKQTEAQRLESSILTKLTNDYNTHKITLEQLITLRGNLTKALTELSAAEKANADRAATVKAEADAIAAAAKAKADFVKAGEASVASTAKQLTQAQDAYTALVQSTDGHIKLKSVLEEEELTRLRLLATTMEQHGEDASYVLQQIEDQKKLIAVLQSTEVLTAANKGADALAKANQKAAEESSKYWEDALMRAFESGKGFFQSLWDTIKNTLKTQVLKVIVQGTMSTLGLGAAGNAAAGGSGYLSTASSLTSLYNTGTKVAGWLGMGSTAGSAYALGTGTGIAATTGVMGGTALGSGLLASGGTAGAGAIGSGLSAGALGGGLSTGATGIGLTATGATTGAVGGTAAAGSLSTALAAVPVWGWVALAAIAAYSIFKKDKTPTTGTGQGALSYDASGNVTDSYAKAEWGGLNDRTMGAISNMQSSYTAAAVALGIKTVATQFSFGSNTGKDGKGNNFAVGVNVNGTSYASAGEQVYSDAAMQLEASRAIFTALQSSELPHYLQGAFNGLTASTATQEQIDNTIAAATALAGFNRNLLLMPEHFLKIASLSYDATQGLIGLSGGLENLQTNLGTYYTNFYTKEEQRLQTIKNINAATAGSGLDAAVTDAKAFRTLVESWGTPEKLATEEGRKMYASLLSVAGGMAILTGGLKDADEELTKKAKAQADANANYQNELAYAKEIADRLKAKQEEIKTAWQSITDGIMAEVDRIRGSLNAGPESLAAAQAKFAIALALAQTRAGDQVAGQSLPGLSQSMLGLAEKNSGSLLDYQRIMGRTANSLAALGGSLTDQYGLKPLTSEADPMVVELRGVRTTLIDGFGLKPANTQNLIVEELRTMRRQNDELRDEIKGLRAESQSSAVSNSKTARLLDRLSPDGNSLQIVVAT